MSKRLTRKQIKEDIRHGDLQTAVSTTYEKILSSQKLIVVAVVAIVALGIVSALVYFYLTRRGETAAKELAAAVEIYDAPVAGDDTAADDAAKSGPRFASDEERRSKAREALQEVEGGAAGDVAGLYLADLALQDGDKAAARQHWQAFLDDHGDDDVLAVAVRLNLIRLDREEGKGEEVVERLEAELVEPEPDLPQDVLLFELAKTLDTLGRGDEAKDYYQRILDDHPRSPYANEAREKTTG